MLWLRDWIQFLIGRLVLNSLSQKIGCMLDLAEDSGIVRAACATSSIELPGIGCLRISHWIKDIKMSHFNHSEHV